MLYSPPVSHQFHTEAFITLQIYKRMPWWLVAGKYFHFIISLQMENKERVLHVPVKYIPCICSMFQNIFTYKKNVKIEICLIKQHFQHIKRSGRKHNWYFIRIPFDSNTMFTLLGIESIVLLIISTGEVFNVLSTRAENSLNVLWVVFFIATSLKHLTVRLNMFLIWLKSCEREGILNVNFDNGFSSFFLTFVVDIHPSRTACQLSHCSRQMLVENHCKHYGQIYLH